MAVELVEMQELSSTHGDDTEAADDLLRTPTVSPSPSTNLLDLPLTLLQHICSYLRPRDVVHLSMSSRQLYGFLHSSDYWLSRLPYLWKVGYPPLMDAVPPVSCPEAVAAREDCFSLWSGLYPHNTQLSLFQHGAAVDVVHLLSNRQFVLGSRDRVFSLYNISDVQENGVSVTPVFCDRKTHQGWIWDVAAWRGEKLVTCSWDQHLRLLDLTTTTWEYKQKFATSVLCGTMLESWHEYVAGLYSGHVMLVDLRIPSTTTIRNDTRPPPHHRRAVLSCCAIRGDQSRDTSSMDSGSSGDMSHVEGEVEPTSSCMYFATSSEDKSVALWDKRSLLAPVHTHKLSMYSQAICSYGSDLWVADRKGVITLFDCSRGTLNSITSVETSASASPILRISADSGCVMVATLGGDVRAFHPTTDLTPFATEPLFTGGKANCIALSRRGRSLVVGCANGDVCLWTASEAFYR